MATVYHNPIATTEFHPNPTAGWFARRLAAWGASRRRAREMQDLASFSDRDLWDVGLSRSDMMALEKGLYRRD